MDQIKELVILGLSFQNPFFILVGRYSSLSPALSAGKIILRVPTLISYKTS
jgi:hypothetical protein